MGACHAVPVPCRAVPYLRALPAVGSTGTVHKLPAARGLSPTIPLLIIAPLVFHSCFDRRTDRSDVSVSALYGACYKKTCGGRTSCIFVLVSVFSFFSFQLRFPHPCRWSFHFPLAPVHFPTLLLSSYLQGLLPACVIGA